MAKFIFSLSLLFLAIGGSIAFEECDAAETLAIEHHHDGRGGEHGGCGH